MDENKASRLQADILGLANTLEERDLFIRKLSGEIAELQGKNAELAAQVATMSASAAQAEEKPAGESTYTYENSRREIERLEEALKGKLSASQVNALVISDLEETRIKRDVAAKELSEQTLALAAAKRQATAAQIENEDLRERLLNETKAAATATANLAVIRQRVDISFTAAQLAGYMSQAIDNFNHEANAGDLSVNYIINDMEVTFKASLSKNDRGEMTLAAPPLSGGDDTLSTVRFNITAVPKDEAETQNI